jgi:uncharacterized integral membrane protein (TIGR00698 family)
MAILVGLLARNTLPLPAALSPGLRFSVTTVLRLGVVCVGIKLSVAEMLTLGLAGIPVVLAAITTGLVVVSWLNRRLGLPARLGTLVAAGTSICGVTAIVATAPVIHATEREVAYAVANVVLFGLVGMLAYPYVAHWLLDSPHAIGLFLGTAIHDTSQVVGAALTYVQVHGDDLVLRVATVTKLTRNLCLAGVIPLLAWWHLRTMPWDGRPAQQPGWRTVVPGFVLGFVAMAAVRSLGDATLESGLADGVFTDDAWRGVTRLVGDEWGARWLLGTAMAAVGLNTSVDVLRGIGVRPFVVGLGGAVAVGLAGLAAAVVMVGLL